MIYWLLTRWEFGLCWGTDWAKSWCTEGPGDFSGPDGQQGIRIFLTGGMSLPGEVRQRHGPGGEQPG